MKTCPVQQIFATMLGDFAGTLVGDPVCVVTGAVLDAEIDFRLPQAPVPITWWRTYNSSRADVVSQVGHGFHHSFAVDLRCDLDGIRYTNERGQSIGFPFLAQDGQSVIRQAHRLTRLTPSRYRVTNAKGLGFVFDFSPASGGRGKGDHGKGDHGKVVAWAHTDGREVAVSWDDITGSIAAIAIDAVYRLEIHTDPQWPTARIARVDLVEWQNGNRHVLVAYTYDTIGRLVAVQDGYHHLMRYAYDDQHRLIRKIDRLGYTFRYTYDENGRCVATRGQDGLEDLTLTYHPLEHMTQVRRADGAVRSYTYDGFGQILQRIEPDGGAVVYAKDRNGRIIGEVDPLGNTTRYRFNSFGNVDSVVDPLGHVRAFPHDATPHPLAHRLAITPMQWDLGQWCAVPSNRVSASEVVATWPKAVHRALAFDQAVSGQPQDVRDYQGLLIRQDDCQGRHRRFGYDANANPRWQQDFDGQITRFGFGSWNHLETQTNPLGLTTHYAYGANDHLISITDPGATRTEYGYDLCDRLAQVRRHGHVRESYAYDLAGNLIAVYDGLGRPRVHRTIGRGNLLKRRTLVSGECYDYEHDEKGRLLHANGPSGACSFAYTATDLRCTDLRDGQGVVHRFAGMTLLQSTTLGRFSVHYHQLDASTLQITDPTGQVIVLRDHGFGLIERIDPCGRAELTQYDLDGRCLLRAAYSRDRSKPHWIRRFHYSGEGDLLIREDSLRGTIRYAMDAAHRLVGQQAADGTKEAFFYDIAGNLLQAPHLVATYGLGNRLHTANGERFEHNDRDHVCARQGDEGEVRYVYDAKDHLVHAKGPSLDYHARFDGLGRRTEKSINGATTHFYWDSDRLAAECLADGRLRIYVYGDHFSRVPLAFVDYTDVNAPVESGKRYMVLANHLGCPEQVLDPHEQVAWQADIAAYGWATVTHGHEFHQPLRWPGHYFDRESGLHDNRFRSYDPRLGRYLQSDPTGLEGTLNLYAYVDNPLRDVDLRGQTKKTCPDEVLDCPNRHEDGGDGEGVPKRKVGDDGQPESVDARYGLTKAQREHFRRMRKEANGDPAKLEQMRFERTQARRRNKGQPEFDDIDAWRNDGRVSGASRNRERGTEVADNSVGGVGKHYDTPMASGDSMPDGKGGTTKYEVDVDNVPPDGNTVRTRPDGISVDENGKPNPGGVVMDNKHFMGPGDQEYPDTEQLQAQRHLAETNGGQHVVSLSSDNPDLSANPPRPRPSSDLSSSTSNVVYCDPNTGQVTHTWNAAKQQWKPV